MFSTFEQRIDESYSEYMDRCVKRVKYNRIAIGVIAIITVAVTAVVIAK